MTSFPNKLRDFSTLNSSRVYLNEFIRRASLALKPGQRVLDAGSGQGWYRRHFDHVRYEGVDFGQVDKEYGVLDCICDLVAIPLAGESYDLVLCTQVLEHLAHPSQALAEMYRILKPDGMLWLSAPLFFAEHEIPHDYFRYTRYGLRQLLTDEGFQVESVEWLEGYFGTLAYQFRTIGRSLPTASAAYGGGIVGVGLAATSLPMRVIAYALAVAFSWLDLRKKHTESGFPKNFAVVARKPG